jgi:hypothetical protein
MHTLVRVDHAEEVLERRAQPHAQTAVGADLERAVALGARVVGVEVRGIERFVEVRRHDLPTGLSLTTAAPGPNPGPPPMGSW